MIVVSTLFYIIVPHALTFHHQNSYFISSLDFAKESVWAIGGLSDYICSLACSSVVGCAIFIGFTAGYMFYVLTKTGEEISHKRDPFFGAIIPISLLFTQYINIAFISHISSALLLTALLHILISIKKVKLRFIFAPFFVGIIYLTAMDWADMAMVGLYCGTYLIYVLLFIKFISKGKWAIFAAIPITLAVSFYIFYKEYNPRLKYIMLMEQKLHAEEWNEVLKLSAEGTVRSKLTCYYTNIALLKTNNFSNYLFNYPQIGGIDGLELSAYEMRTSDLIYDIIGAPLEALHCAFENYVTSGKNIYNLPKLIYYYDKTGKEHIADRFAVHIPSHKRVKPTGYISHGADSSLVGTSIINTLEAICKTDTLNLPAFECLMAYYAMSGRIVKFIDNIERAKQLFKGTLPTYYQDIIILYKEVLPKEQQQEIDYNVAQSRVDLFNKFKESLKKRGASASQFGSTYWFYNKYLNPAGEKLYTN